MNQTGLPAPFPLAKPIPLRHVSRGNKSGANDPDITGRTVMLTRRGFAGVASCALCSITGFMATDASAQGTPPAATPGVSRKILSRSDGPAAGYETLQVAIEIEAGVTIGRHTHPGIESAYMLDGGFDLPIEGQPTVAFKPGMGVVVPANTPHAGGKNGDKKTHIVSTYIVEKGKPLASPA